MINKESKFDVKMIYVCYLGVRSDIHCEWSKSIAYVTYTIDIEYFSEYRNVEYYFRYHVKSKTIKNFCK